MGLWGYNPVMLERYAELIAATQTGDLSSIEMTLHGPQEWHPIYSMLRLAQVIRAKGEGHAVEHYPDPLPRFQFLESYRVAPDRQSALRAVMDPDFDFRSVVILEEKPTPAPEPASDDESEAPSLRIVDESTDHVSLDIDIDRPAILLMTDSYSEGWEVRSRDPEHTGSYRLIPANYALRAVPLSEGHHQLQIEYRPSAFRIGSIVSGVSLILYTLLFVFWAFARLRATRRPEQ